MDAGVDLFPTTFSASLIIHDYLFREMSILVHILSNASPKLIEVQENIGLSEYRGWRD